MHSFFTLRRTFISFVVLMAFFTGCTRIRSTEVGAGLIPPVDGVITLDTLLDVVTDTFDDTDSARIYKTDNHIVGAISNDPIFGKTKASMYFELKPQGYPFYIPGEKDSTIADSAVLILSYRGVYGDSMAPLRLHVYEINPSTPLDPYTAYPINYPSSLPVTLGAEMAPPVTLDIRRLKDSIHDRFENSVNQIRIKMNSSVATRFIKTYDSTNAYKSDSIFRTFFAGFALVADAGGANALVKISLTDTNTKFSLYYSSSSSGATKRDTSVLNLTFNSISSGNANMIVRDRTGSDAAKHITTTSKPDSLVYVQTSPGTYVRIKVPGLPDLYNRIIHRAELIAEQVPDDANLTTIETQMLPPRYLLLSHYDSVGKTKRNIPNDYTTNSTEGPNIASFGGYLTSKAINGYDKVAAYTFNITRYVQGIVTRKDTSFTLRLSAPANDSLVYRPPYPLVGIPGTTAYLSPSIGNETADGRVRLGGGTHSRFRMRVRIVFSRL